MEVKKIEFDDKISTITSPLPEINRITGSNVNEIKEAINNNANILENNVVYSTTEEKEIGIWIDNKTIYRKVLYISALPNATTENYPTGVDNIDYCVNLYGMATNGIPLNCPRPDSNDRTNEIGCWFSPTTNMIRISTGMDRSSVDAYVIMEYTKTEV